MNYSVRGDVTCVLFLLSQFYDTEPGNVSVRKSFQDSLFTAVLGGCWESPLQCVKAVPGI